MPLGKTRRDKRRKDIEMKQHIGGAEEMTQQLSAYTALEELSSGS